MVVFVYDEPWLMQAGWTVSPNIAHCPSSVLGYIWIKATSFLLVTESYLECVMILLIRNVCWLFKSCSLSVVGLAPLKWINNSRRLKCTFLFWAFSSQSIERILSYTISDWLEIRLRTKRCLLTSDWSYPTIVYSLCLVVSIPHINT